MTFEERQHEHYVSVYVKHKLKRDGVTFANKTKMLDIFGSIFKIPVASLHIKTCNASVHEEETSVLPCGLDNLQNCPNVAINVSAHKETNEFAAVAEGNMFLNRTPPSSNEKDASPASRSAGNPNSCDDRDVKPSQRQCDSVPTCCVACETTGVVSYKDCSPPRWGNYVYLKVNETLALRDVIKSCLVRMSIDKCSLWQINTMMGEVDVRRNSLLGSKKRRLVRRRAFMTFMVLVGLCPPPGALGFSNEFDKTEQFMEKVNLEQSLAAIFNKVAYGGTTKRSIPENAYPTTTLATPPLTTYRFTDGNNEWLSVDVKKPEPPRSGIVDYDRPEDAGRRDDTYDSNYGADLEKDHGLPTPASNADILKNNNNKNYENPNRYNNDRLRPDYDLNNNPDQVTENVYKTTTSYNVLRNVRPTKSIYSKDVHSYVPPSRAFFTPPLPPEYVNPFADKPTLRGTSTDGFANRRPIPPPSLMPNKDRIPFRPDLPPSKAVNAERPIERPMSPLDSRNDTQGESKNERKKTLNTPSQNANFDRIGDYYGLNRNINESSFEYEKAYIPSITRILSGSNGRHDDIPDILLRTVTSTPIIRQESKITKSRVPQDSSSGGSGNSRSNNPKMQETDNKQPAPKKDEKPTANDGGLGRTENIAVIKKEVIQESRPSTGGERSESVTIRKDISDRTKQQNNNEDITTQTSDIVNLPNVKEKDANVTKASSEDIWLICWNVHVYLVVLCFVALALYSIFKLIRYENDPHMFSKSYFLTIHLMLTVICVLRIFYLAYDPYNVNRSFNIFLYDFLHNFPLSLLATTFAVLILFLLKRTLTHLKVKTRPVFLVSFGLIHIFLCFCLSISETLGHFERASLIICKPVFVLLAWALGISYLYLYKIIKNVLAKKSQNLSEMCTQNISYASHITIAVALLFVLLGFVQLYALFFIKEDRFNDKIKHHWILWGFELSVRLLEISIVTLLAIVVSLKMSQREKQTVGFPLFPCTTSDSSTDNIYPNNCNTNPNAVNYSRNEMILDNLPTEPVERPNLLKNSFQNDSFDKKSTLERYQSDGERNFERFERPKWGSDRFDKTSDRFDKASDRFDKTSDRFDKVSDRYDKNSDRFEKSSDRFDKVSDRYDKNSDRFEKSSDRFEKTSDRFDNRQNLDQGSLNNFSQPNSGHFERSAHQNSSRTERTSARKTYDSAKYYTKPKYDLEYSNDDYQHDSFGQQDHNVYSEPIDQNHQYERTRHEFERSDFERRSRNSTNTSGRRSTGRTRKNHARPHLGVQTLPNHDHRQHQLPDSMLVDDQGFVRFRHMQEVEHGEKPKRIKKQNTDVNHYSDA